ncbi:EAL domain-containing protein [Butyrivibrio sp. AE3004]|uniref:EAL domain-containing protein n=1 Tax=Butyrivibrio sp. AE3004 TaxID=1506994 RepID=UPI0004940364|nr:EAL domain-containing protein [Butyrivibrio sp. AE3004]
MTIREGEQGSSELYQKDEFLKIIDSKAENDELSASFCCVFIVVENFRQYYMNYGFDEGYQVLTFVRKKIRNAFPVDIASKIEDSEFAVITDIDDVETFIIRIQKDFDEVYIHTGMSLRAGIYPISKDDKSAEKILVNASIACTNGERKSDGISVFNNQSTDNKILMQHYVVHHLEQAIENGEISVYYQPIFHTYSGKVCGHEALARWLNSEYGILYPNDFVPVLEHSKKINLLDCFVIRQVCKDLSDIKKDTGLDPVPISINLTRLDFELADMLKVVETEVERYGLSRKLIQIEISEAEITTDRKGIKKELERFRDKGFTIIFDDFGSEYSSLHILNDMPFDAVKINSSFLEGYNYDKKPRIMMKNVINMAKELGIHTMMGSVEDEEILEFLKQAGCEKTQGHLYSEAVPMWYYPEGGYPFEYENENERNFYNEIGNVNILSQTPIEEKHLDENEVIFLNQLPLAMLEYDGNSFRILMYSKDFNDIFEPLFAGDIKFIDDLFNSPRHSFARNVRSLAAQCVDNDAIHSMEFVTTAGYNRLMLRRITGSKELKKTAILATAEAISENDAGTRAVQMNMHLKFLYMIYNRVDIVNVSEDSFETVYENHAKYNQTMQKGPFSKAIKSFANDAIYNEDREGFLEFYNLNNLDERLNEYNIDHLTDYFRTIDAQGNYNWLMYLLIPIVSEGNRMFIMGSRSIDSERMRKLPDISQSGSEYYDMPSDPTFLLLASDAFTDTLGYGSFEQFIRNTFYLEANLTENKTVYMHLGQSGLISDFGETGYIELPFSDVTKSMVFSQVTDEDQEKMYEFYDRDRLLSEYEKGILSGRMVYLERTGTNDQPRYQNACYHMRKTRQNDTVHIFILKYDIDQFKRTNETIRNLAERDTLTGLFNRMTIGKVYESLVENEDTKSLAMVLLDLDHFKQINDNYGHDCGDKVIKDAARRMQNNLGEDCYPSRIGGDEFLVIIRNQSEENIDSLLKAFSEDSKTIDYNGETVKYTMSLGYSVYPDDGKAYNELYKNADKALYYVKENGKNNYAKYKERR